MRRGGGEEGEFNLMCVERGAWHGVKVEDTYWMMLGRYGFISFGSTPAYPWHGLINNTLCLLDAAQMVAQTSKQRAQRRELSLQPLMVNQRP